MESIDDKVSNLEKRVAKIYNVGWVIGIVATIFGISGAWGIKVINDGSEKIRKLDSNIAKLSYEFDKSDSVFGRLRKENEDTFTNFIRNKEVLFTSDIIKDVKDALLILPAGSIISFGGKIDQIPKGWLLCDGRSVIRNDYRVLFQNIGTNWGSKNGERI